MCDVTYIEVANRKQYKKDEKCWYNNTYKQNSSCGILHNDKAQNKFWYVWFNIYALCEKTYDKNWGGKNEII